MNKVGMVESVTLRKNIMENLDYCEIIIDFDALAIFGKYSELVEYIGKKVEYSDGPDIYDGMPIQRVYDIAEKKIIQVLEREDNIKLIPAGAVARPALNFDSSKLKMGDTELNCTALLSSWVQGSSNKTGAKWLDLTLVDAYAKQFPMRIFISRLESEGDPIKAVECMVGQYVRFNATRTQFGIQTDILEPLNVDVVAPPEVEIAYTQIEKAIADDEELCSYVNQYDLLNYLKGVMCTEIGYHLVAIASEIYLINAITDISVDYDKKLLIRAAVTSRGYLLPANTKFSMPLMNTNKVLRSELKKDRELLLILDVFAGEEISLTKNMYITIKKLANEIIRERREVMNGVLEISNQTKEPRTNCSAIFDTKSEFNGLL